MFSAWCEGYKPAVMYQQVPFDSLLNKFWNFLVFIQSEERFVRSLTIVYCLLRTATCRHWIRARPVPSDQFWQYDVAVTKLHNVVFNLPFLMKPSDLQMRFDQVHYPSFQMTNKHGISNCSHFTIFLLVLVFKTQNFHTHHLALMLITMGSITWTCRNFLFSLLIMQMVYPTGDQFLLLFHFCPGITLNSWEGLSRPIQPIMLQTIPLSLGLGWTGTAQLEMIWEMVEQQVEEV